MSGTCSTGGDGEVRKGNGSRGRHKGGWGRGKGKPNLTEIRLIVRLVMFEDTEIRFGYRISKQYLVWATSIRNFLGSLSTVIMRKAKRFCFTLHDKASAKETDWRETSSCGIDAGMLFYRQQITGAETFSCLNAFHAS
jgi:hypothetical protein